MPSSPSTSSPTPAWPRELRASVVKTRLGYVAHVSHGVMRVGEVGWLPFAFTRRGLERKLRRLARRLKAAEARRVEELVL